MIGLLLLACRIAPPDLPTATAIHVSSDGTHVVVTCTLHNTGDAALSQRVQAVVFTDSLAPALRDEVLLEAPARSTRTVDVVLPIPEGPSGPGCSVTELCTTANGSAVRANCNKVLGRR